MMLQIQLLKYSCLRYLIQESSSHDSVFYAPRLSTFAR
jgi:hypothetical protein